MAFKEDLLKNKPTKTRQLPYKPYKTAVRFKGMTTYENEQYALCTWLYGPDRGKEALVVIDEAHPKRIQLKKELKEKEPGQDNDFYSMKSLVEGIGSGGTRVWPAVPDQTVLVVESFTSVGTTGEEKPLFKVDGTQAVSKEDGKTLLTYKPQILKCAVLIQGGSPVGEKEREDANGKVKTVPLINYDIKVSSMVSSLGYYDPYSHELVYRGIVNWRESDEDYLRIDPGSERTLSGFVDRLIERAKKNERPILFIRAVNRERNTVEETQIMPDLCTSFDKDSKTAKVLTTEEVIAKINAETSKFVGNDNNPGLVNLNVCSFEFLAGNTTMVSYKMKADRKGRMHNSFTMKPFENSGNLITMCAGVVKTHVSNKSKNSDVPVRIADMVGGGVLENHGFACLAPWSKEYSPYLRFSPELEKALSESLSSQVLSREVKVFNRDTNQMEVLSQEEKVKMALDVIKKAQDHADRSFALYKKSLAKGEVIESTEEGLNMAYNLPDEPLDSDLPLDDFQAPTQRRPSL